MSAEGRISRTWWNAHLLNGEVRQFASVTCVSGRGGNPSIKRPVIALSRRLAIAVAEPCREWLHAASVVLPARRSTSHVAEPANSLPDVERPPAPCAAQRQTPDGQSRRRD